MLTLADLNASLSFDKSYEVSSTAVTLLTLTQAKELASTCTFASYGVNEAPASITASTNLSSLSNNNLRFNATLTGSVTVTATQVRYTNNTGNPIKPNLIVCVQPIYKGTNNVDYVSSTYVKSYSVEFGTSVASGVTSYHSGSHTWSLDGETISYSMSPSSLYNGANLRLRIRAGLSYSGSVSTGVKIAYGTVTMVSTVKAHSIITWPN